MLFPIEDTARRAELIGSRACINRCVRRAISTAAWSSGIPPARTLSTWSAGGAQSGRVAEPLTFRHAVNFWRLLQSVVPKHLERRHVPIRGEVETNDRRFREHE